MAKKISEADKWMEENYPYFVGFFLGIAATLLVQKVFLK